MKYSFIFYKLVDYIKPLTRFNTVITLDLRSDNILLIDLIDESNHWGDILFFAPLVEFLYSNGFNFTVIDPYDFYKVLYDLKDIDNFVFNSVIYRSDRPKYHIFENKVKINFYEFEPMPIARRLFQLVSGDRNDYYNSLSSFRNRLIEHSKLRCNLNTISRYISDPFALYSPGINSRKFGFYPSRKSVLSQIRGGLFEMNSKGLNIIKIGDSKSSEIALVNANNFITTDLSNMTNIWDLIYLINSINYRGMICYDNLPYHLATIFNKEVQMCSKSWLTFWEYQWVKHRFTPGF